MPTPEELKASFSFIGPFQSDTVLQPYKHNALPLYAAGLYLGIEDMESFAIDNLTDHPSDKKADIIYIDEAEGIAFVAQGTTANEWGKPEASANKASDLNAAIAWLLTQAIGDVPAHIRGHAKLLREGLSLGTIDRLVIACAHNAYESTNVHNELKAAGTLASSIELTEQCEVETVELGLRTIEALYLSSRGTIQVTKEIQFPASEYIKEIGNGWTSYALTIDGGKLFDLYEEHGKSLFSANLRDYMGMDKRGNTVNNTIRNTVESEAGLFYIFNNGITIISKKAKQEDDILSIQGMSIVNGAQTTGAIHAAGRGNAENVSVLGRVVVVDDDAMNPGIVTANNTQNAIVAWDRRSRDPVQVRLGQEFRSKGMDYVYRRDEGAKGARAIVSDKIGQMLCAFGGDLQTAIRGKREIFEDDRTYNKVFPQDIPVGHVLAVQTLGWAFEVVKKELKEKASDGSLTDLEGRQLRLLEYSASKQFVVRVMGDLREEIGGRGCPQPFAFEFVEEAFSADGADGIEAWTTTIKALLPTVIEDLPDEEYRVVRSSDHTKTVVERTRGIVAGAAALQSSFDDLRAMLRPGKGG